MSNHNKTVIRRRLTAYFLTVILVLSLFSDFISVTYAETTVGSSGYISATGGNRGLAGGVSHIEKPSFRVGIMRDPGLYHDGTSASEKEMVKSWSHRFPDNNNSIFFVPYGEWDLYKKYDVGRYNPSTRRMEKYSDKASLARVQPLKSSGSSYPDLKGKELLAGCSFTGVGKTKLYSSLANGKWKTIANKISTDNANDIWSYVLARVGGGYKVEERLNAVISPYAKDWGKKKLTQAQLEDIGRGYLGLLMTTWRLVPTQFKAPWEQAIEDYITDRNQGKDQLPSALVIDTGTTLSFYSTGRRLIMPTIDYFQYYTAVSAKWNIHKTTAKQLGSKWVGDTYDILERIVDGDIADYGNKIGRTSSHYDASNPFAVGAGAIAYPYRRFSTSSGDGMWKPSSLETAIMDVFTLGKSASGGTIRGFIVASFSLPLDPPCEDCEPAGGILPPPTPPAKAKILFTATPDDKLVPSGSEKIGQKVTLTFAHKPDAALINSWKKIFAADKNANKTIKVTITPNRQAGPITPPSYSSSKGNFTKGVNLPQGEFLAFLQGKMPIVMLDNTENEPIAPNSKVIFTYKPKIRIDYTLNGEPAKWETVLQDSASFRRLPEPPDPITYTSKPSAYAEFKEGSPDNEEFEAMAGVPSTKRLYLGVGGSEFVVDVELEYKENVYSVWRTYRSWFSGTPSEFKDGDTWKGASVPAPSGASSSQLRVDHFGGTVTATWTGTRKWTGSVKYGDHWTSVTNKWDDSEYNAAKAQAQAWVSAVNSFTVSHTSASDKKTRTFNNWGASITTDSKVDGTPGWANPGQPYIPPSYDSKGNMTNPGQPYVAASGADGTDGSYTITVTARMPAHEICGPECLYDLPPVEDTWKQRIKFDYMKIIRAEVYKIEEGRIKRVDNVLGEGNSELKATIQSSDPTIFYNIAQKNAGGDDVAAQSSKYGRLRYSLETNQHDKVEWYEGVRSNKSAGMGKNGNPNSPQGGGHNNPWAKGILYNNPDYTTEKDYHRNRGGVNTNISKTADAIDVQTPEWKKFDERRKSPVKATVISDMLILQTSSGDQSVIYFAKDSKEVQAQEQFPEVNATKEEMWDNNPYSAAKWKDNQIYMGSYNGRYWETGNGSANNKKYWGFNQVTDSFIDNSSGGATNRIETAFEKYNTGVGVNGSTPRSARPSKLYIYGTAPIERTTPNGAYDNDGAEVFYERVLSWKSPNPYTQYPGVQLKPDAYKAEVQPNFGDKIGFVIDAPYSPNHEKVNDIVIHTPVSVEDATIISLPKERDQRTETPPGGAEALIKAQNDLKVCPLDPALCEFRVLNCKYRQDTELVDIDFENFTSSTIYNKTTGAYIPYETSNGIKIAPKSGFGSGNVLHAFGTRWSLNFSDIGLTNDKYTNVLVEMDFYMPTQTSGTMIVSFDQYDLFISMGGVGTLNTGNGWEKRIDGVNFVGTPMKLGIQFSLGHIEDTKVFINGVEHTAFTRINDSNDVNGLIGTKLNIGSWGTNDNYPAQFYIDNLKIIKKGGTFEHTNVCYITTVNHEVKWTHQHTPACYPNGDTTKKPICNNLPINTLSQNNKHVHDASCIYPIAVSNPSSTQTVFDFNYTGNVQKFTAPETGVYQLEVWGAQGGSLSETGYSPYRGSTYGVGGKGGYSKGEVTLKAGETLYIYVGGKGNGTSGGWNGGGAGRVAGAGGGGATDIRKGGTTLDDRIIVAGGGGGAQYGDGGAGGGMNGMDSPTTVGGDSISNFWGTRGTGGGQTLSTGSGQWGVGQDARTGSDGLYGGAGGGGYVGGGSAISDSSRVDDYGGAGGSGYIGGVTNGQTIAGNQQMPSPSGGTEIGHSGNGFARITKLSSSADNSGIAGYTWEEIFGPNWKNYVKVGSSSAVEGQVFTFNYTGSVQTFTVPADGEYLLEVWGAQGGVSAHNSSDMNRGGYSKGKINLQKGSTVYVYVGGKGEDGTSISMTPRGGFNGGGDGGYGSNDNAAGGGATDIRVGGTSLSNRVIVAGGGGGNGCNTTGGVGGGLVGGDGTSGSYEPSGKGGTQTSGGSGYQVSGSLGQGANGYSASTWGSGGGGGGYYGGGAGASLSGGASAGGGGSSYIGGVIDGETLNGGQTMPAPTGGTQIGQKGNGYAKITVLKTKTVEVDWDKVKADAGKGIFPELMWDKRVNPIFGCTPYYGGDTPVGVFETGATMNGVEITTVTNPSTGKGTKAVKLKAGVNVPTITSKDLNLGEKAEFKLEFDYWADSDDVEFKVDLSYDDLPKIRLTAMKEVKHATWHIKSESTNMQDAKLRIFNDLSVPNPANIYVTNIRLNGKPIYNVHEHTAACTVTKTLACTEPHHFGAHYDGSNPICWDACGNDANHQQLKPSVKKSDGTTIKAGTFVNLDYPFQIYFPNRGDFAQQPTLKGISSITTVRGKGFVNDMDTTEYTLEKRVKFDFNVVFNGVLYTSGSWISLPVNQEIFEFYCPVANPEAMGASVQFDVVPVNGRPVDAPENDNFVSSTNRERFADFSAYHGAFKETYVDVVGRIGNFVVSDTEDFRFSNLFKQDDPSGGWLVEGLVRKVDPYRQKRYYGDLVDIRGEGIENNGGRRLDTYGTQPWLRQQPLPFPINPKDNQIPALKEQFLKVGYDILGDIQTIGSYQDGVVRAIPYYYKLDLDTGVVTPLDAYVKKGEQYKPVNKYRGADSGSLPPDLYSYELVLDWENESPRRNFTMDESIITDRVAEIHGEYITGMVELPDGGGMEQGVTGIKRLTTPLGNFASLGNAQRIVADKKARTFIGSSKTYGVNMNPDDLDGSGDEDNGEDWQIDLGDWQYAVQRWHLKFGLPASTVFVEAGKEPKQENFDAVKKGNGVILMAVDIVSIGNVYTLRWKQPGISSFTVTKGGKSRTFDISQSGLPPVIALFDLEDTAVIDITVKGSH